MKIGCMDRLQEFIARDYSVIPDMEGEIERLSIGLGDGELHLFTIGQLARPWSDVT